MFKVLPISPYEGYLGRVCFCAFSHSRGQGVLFCATQTTPTAVSFIDVAE